ncbi:MAG: SagB/ThcOx family dehydrogenase [Anaerolineaceae bacterium]|jgi:SagB-type dehydrogenase family enzyme
MDKFDSLGQRFLELTYFSNQAISPDSQGEPIPDYIPPILGLGEEIPLPPHSEVSPKETDFRIIAEQRRSVRRYDEASALSLAELSYLLWYSQGIKKITNKRGLSLRMVPSAGCRHPFETYLAVHRVDGLQPGLYHYVPQNNSVEVVDFAPETLEAINHATNDQNQVITSAVTFIWVANPYRTSWRHSSRAYRYIFIDAGHVAQNLALAAESINCGTCAIGAYIDEEANAALKLDGKEQFVIYLTSVGRKLSSD